MQIQNGASPPTPKACQNLARLYLFTITLAAADLCLLSVLEVLLWSA
ncbi:hypothetical protein [Pseudomonas borbori]|uniref:Uncharacterized protein n=1 Tax=Pseudomonas borbori TaxID=289003 RepID=A0A1I5VJW6_9PSED|nr:hypothetical protein [Pseudomonas borbori]SFQ07868.1 hypothetical protein SAMN05216190_13162 [Pseudomonas borbori]